jgi:hypothetical protein
MARKKENLLLMRKRYRLKKTGDSAFILASGAKKY